MGSVGSQDGSPAYTKTIAELPRMMSAGARPPGTPGRLELLGVEAPRGEWGVASPVRF